MRSYHDLLIKAGAPQKTKARKLTGAGAVGAIYMPEASLKQKQALGIWPGKISLNSSQKVRLKKVTNPKSLEMYFIKADSSAPARCIDGRPIADWSSSTQLKQRGLGAQEPGGTAADALIHRIIMMGEVGGPNITFSKDLKDTINTLTKKRIFFGGHIDEHNENHPENTGCGAIDRMPEILAQMVYPKAFREIKALSQILLGDVYDDAIANELIGRLVLLQADSEEYLRFDQKSGTYLYKHEVIEVMRKNASNKNPIEKLAGQHSEKGMVINMVRGTTFDRDKFSHDSTGKIQLFNYDAWRTSQVAALLYPDKKISRKMKKHQQEYIICRTMYAIATAMILTDGSLELFIRR